MSITMNPERCGNFTSSEIYRLLGTSKVAETYIHEKNLERKLGRCLSLEKSTRSMSWGHFMEKYVHENKLSMSYALMSDTTVLHPDVAYWAGSPDNVNKKESVVGDTKCFEPKAFCEYVDCIIQNDIELFKKLFPKEYWQLVSNACILGMKFIEPIAYMPYLSEIPAIKKAAQEADPLDPWKFGFIVNGDISELAYLPDGGYYKDLNIVRFEVPLADKKLLTEAVVKAGAHLIPRQSIAA